MIRKDEKNTITLFKWIWQSYLRTALIPLILVELVFISIYFTTNNWSRNEMVNHIKDEASSELKNTANKEADIINNQLSSITNATKLYRNEIGRSLLMPAAISLEDSYRLSYSDDGVYYTTKDKEDCGAAVFYSGVVPVGESERNKVARMLTLQNLMKDIKQSQPLAASIYFNTFDSLNVIYPYFDVLKQYPIHMDIPKYNFYYEADKEHNPNKEIRWTESYLDPAGHGWMTSAVAPVYNGEFLEGVVGMDVTINTVTNKILDMEFPWKGYGILVGKDGKILALPDKGEKDWGLTELTEHHYDEAITKDTFKPDDFNIFKKKEFESVAKQIESDENGLVNIVLNNESKVLAWDTVPETGWKLLIIAPEENIYAKVNNTSNNLFKIGGFMIVGLVFFYSIFFFILSKKSFKMSKNISKSLLKINGIVEGIGLGNYYQKQPDLHVKELRDTAGYLIEMGYQLGNTNKDLLITQEKLKKREVDLEALVNSIDDIILEVDETGTIKKMWTKDESVLSRIFKNETSNNISLIMNSETMRLCIEKIKKVIDTGNPETIEYGLDTSKGFGWFQARMSVVNNNSRTVVMSARDITDRKEMEQSIIESKEDADKANKAKSEFLSSMSHELRTPLNAILGFSQVLELDPEYPLSESQGDCVKQIIKAGNHLLELINEVLDLAKIESGKFTISIEPVQVKWVMEEALEIIEPMADRYNINIAANLPEDEDYFVLADRIRLKQVLINLLSNAVKYNRKNGEVKFYCDKNGDFIRLNVIDNGYGIVKSELEAIFTPFQRLNSENSNIEGTGIGLTVAKQLMELMNGQIYVESKEGVGSHFWIELPYCDEIYDEKKLSQLILENERFMDGDENYKVLYVEDNPTNLNLVNYIIKNIPNVKMFSATHGGLGIELAITHKPDIILLDINLPGMDGYEVLRRLKEHEETKEIPVIAISANAMEKDIERGINLGFDAYITKPLNVSKFIDKLFEILHSKDI